MRLGFVERERVVAGDGELHHLEAMRGRGLRCAAMPRLPGWNPAHVSEAERFARFLGEAQVGVVRRVERPAHEADGLHASRRAAATGRLEMRRISAESNSAG